MKNKDIEKLISLLNDKELVNYVTENLPQTIGDSLLFKKLSDSEEEFTDYVFQTYFSIEDIRFFIVERSELYAFLYDVLKYEITEEDVKDICRHFNYRFLFELDNYPSCKNRNNISRLLGLPEYSTKNDILKELENYL